MHSMRKLARGNGCSKDDTDHRARWKSDKRQQDDTPAPQCHTLMPKLLVLFVTGVHVHTTQRKSDYVMPHPKDHVPRQIAIVLGRALLWQICDAETRNDVVPTEIRHRVEDAAADLEQTYPREDGYNLVDKIPLLCDGVDAQVIMKRLLTKTRLKLELAEHKTINAFVGD